MLKLVLKVKSNMTHETLLGLVTDETLSELEEMKNQFIGNEENERKLIIVINQMFSLIGTE